MIKKPGRLCRRIHSLALAATSLSPTHGLKIIAPRCLCALVSLWLARLSSSAAETKMVLFFGDSLTAGYGLEDPSA